MKGFKFQPVAWMTAVLAVLTALMTLDETIDVLPEAVSPFVIGAIAVLTVVLGVIVKGKVTPTAAPKDDAGTPLVPKAMVSAWREQPAADLPRPAWEPKHVERE